MLGFQSLERIVEDIMRRHYGARHLRPANIPALRSHMVSQLAKLKPASVAEGIRIQLPSNSR